MKNLTLAIFISFLANASSAQLLSKAYYEDGIDAAVSKMAFEDVGNTLATGFEDHSFTVYSDSGLKTNLSDKDLKNMYFYYATMQVLNPINDPLDPYDLLDTMLYMSYGPAEWTFRKTKNGAIGITINPVAKSVVYVKASDIKKKVAQTVFNNFLHILDRASAEVSIEGAGEIGEGIFERIQTKLLEAATSGSVKIYLYDSLKTPSNWDEVRSIGDRYEKVVLYDESGEIAGDTFYRIPLDMADVSGIGTSLEVVGKNGLFVLKTKGVALLFHPIIAGMAISSQALFWIKPADFSRLLTKEENNFLQDMFERGVQIKLMQPINQY